MLSSVVGRSPVERAKTVAITVLAGLSMAALSEVWTANALAAHEIQDREASADVAARFVRALTTYDYAHPNIQSQQLEAVSSYAVEERVQAASVDLARAQGSSVGEVTRITVVELTKLEAHVLVATSQVISGAFVRTGTSVVGLLYVTVIRTPDGWVVSDYRWLLSPSDSP